MNAELEDLLGAYWDLAYEEGSTKVSNGTAANEVLHKIREAWNRRVIPASVPGGFVLVPVNPTEKMVEAGETVRTSVYDDFKGNEHVEIGERTAIAVWQLMLDAAPTPPVQDDRKDAEQAINEIMDLVKGYGDERAVAAYHGPLHNKSEPAEILVLIKQAIAAAAPTPPVQDDRKDAERWRWITREGRTRELRIPASEGKSSINAAIDKAMEGE